MSSIDGPDKHWSAAILEIVEPHAGCAISLQDIYAQMRTLPLVTSYHLQPWRSGGQPRYQCWIRRCLTDLVRAGKVRRTGTAIYMST